MAALEDTSASALPARVPLSELTPADARTLARILRTLAHPDRLQILTHLRQHGPSTSTELGQALNLVHGDLQRHVRELRALGLLQLSGPVRRPLTYEVSTAALEDLGEILAG